MLAVALSVKIIYPFVGRAMERLACRQTVNFLIHGTGTYEGSVLLSMEWQGHVFSHLDALCMKQFHLLLIHFILCCEI